MWRRQVLSVLTFLLFSALMKTKNYRKVIQVLFTSLKLSTLKKRLDVTFPK